MVSAQTMSDDDRRAVARWAADCAEHVLALFDGDGAAREVVRDGIARTRAYADGQTTAGEQIKLRFVVGRAAKAATTKAGAAAARAAGQASGVAHMGAHALGAAAYAANAASLAAGARPGAMSDEIRWQLEHLDDHARAALGTLPALGEDSSGPLGPGLLTSGVLAEAIREIQADVGTA